MPDSKAINNPFLDDQNINNASEPGGSKFDPSTAKPVVNTIPTLKDKNSKFDPSTAKAVDKGFGGHVRDLGASLMGGLASVPDVAVGVADLYSGGRAGKAVDNLSENFKLGDGRKYWQDQKTDHAKVQSQEFSDAEGIIDKTKVALSNPSMITNTVVESLPSMALGGLAGRGLNVASKGLINPVAAGAAGEGLVMAGAQAEQIRQETDDGLLTGKQVAAAAGTGVAGSLLGFLGGTVAKKLGFEDVDTLMARGVKPEQMANEISQIPFSSIPKSVVLGAISEGLLEEMPQSVTEQVLQNYALDKDLFEGVDDAIVMGTLAGMAMGGTVAGASQASKWAGQPNTENPELGDDTDTTGSAPMLPAPTGGNGGTGLGFDGLQGEYIPAGQQGATDPAQARQNFEYDQMPIDADNQITYGEQSQRSAPKPSEQMGLDPNLGPLSAAAATAVDSGISQQMQIEMQAQTAAETASNVAGKTEDSNAPLQQAADAVRELTPEQIHGKQNTYGADVTTAIEQLKQRQQGDQNAAITIDEGTQNGTIQQGNAPLNNGSQSVSEQHDTNAASAMGAETGAVQNELQPAQSDAGQGTSGTSILPTGTETTGELKGLTETKQIAQQQLGEVDSQISSIKQQLSAEKSVPKKLQMRNQLKSLNTERTAIIKENELVPLQEPSLRENARNDPSTTSSFQTQPLDHGALNVPLSKRGNINAQLDQYKKEQAASENEKREIQKSNHADMQSVAKPIFDNLSVEQIKTYANKAGITPSEARKELKSMAHWQPKKAVKVFEALKAVRANRDESTQTTSPTIQSMDAEIQTAQEQLLSTKSVLQKNKIHQKINELQNTRAAHEAATSPHNDLPEPTQAQIEAGNYKKGHIKVHGLNIAVENPRGSERRGTDPDGKEWAHTMSDHYGYIKSSIGSDNEQIDTYIGRNPESEQVFIVDQIDQKTGGFDEHKVMMGFNSQEEAVQAYSSNFDKGWKVGPVRAMNKDEFKSWLKDGDTKKPAGGTLTNEGTKEAPRTTETALDEKQVKASYGDSLESVMSDVETLGDDFTIDLHSVPKKRNALKNPNYHAVQHENGRVEILGMKHPATGEWVGKAPLQEKAPVQDSPAPEQEQSKDIESNSPGKTDSSSKVQSLNIQIQSDSGLSHSIPSKLMDQAHKISDVVNDLMNVKSDGVKTNVLYGKRLLAKIAKLNPDVQIHIVSDLNLIKDNTIRAGLVDGGYYVPAQNTSYIYPKSDAWESSVLELINHELVHSVSEQIIFDGLIPQKHDQKLNNIITEIGEYLFENSDLLSENSVDRLVYAFNTNPQHEVLAVGTAETEVRNSLKKILGNDGLLDLDGIFTAITEQFGNSNEQRKQSSNIGNGKKILHGTVPSTDTGAAGKLQDVPTGTESSKKRERSTDVNQANLSIGEKQQGLDEQIAALDAQINEEPRPKLLERARLRKERDALVEQRDGKKPELEPKPQLTREQREQRAAEKEMQGIIEAYDRLYKDQPISAIEKSLERLNKDIQKQHESSLGEVSNGKRSTRKAVAAGARDRFLKDRHDLEKYLKHRKTQAKKQRLAPNGKPSNLTEKQWQQVRTPEFKAWFGDWENDPKNASKVLDENGEPLVVYHGTDSKINVFKKAKQKISKEPGFFFSTDKEQASMFGENIIPSFLNMRDFQTINGNGEFYFGGDLQSAMQSAIANKQDGVLYENVKDRFYLADQYIVFESNQIKSAVDNNGKFDTENPNILYSRQSGNQKTGKTVEQVRDALVKRFGEKTISSLEKRGLLDIVSTVDEPGVEGLYQNGRVTLVANNLNETSIIPTFLHELGGHGGFQNVMSEEKYADLMGIFNDMVKRKHPLALEAKRLAERETDTKTQQLEYLPYLLTLASTQQEMNALQKSAIKRFIDKVVSAVKAWAFDRLGINLNLNENDLVALANRMVNQIGNQAQQNTDTNQNPLYSRSSDYSDITNRISNGLKNLPKPGDWINKKGVDWLGLGLGFLSRRHLTEIYGKLLPQLNKYNELAAQMDADKNDIAAGADNIVHEWSKLKDEEALANVMHDATLAQIDPAKPHQPGDDRVKYQQLLKAYNSLSPESQAMYKKARNAYSAHYAKVHEAIRDRILRSALSSQKKADLLKNIEGSFGQIKGVYFPLARFGEYIIVMRNKNGDVASVSRAETMGEAESVRSELMKKYPQFKVDPVKLDKEYSASRDGVGRGFMSDLFDEVGNLGLDKKAQAEFEDTLSQLYLSSMPDLSWAKHGIHRKGTAGFSQDARRAFAQHMFSGANYLGKLRYGDQLAQQLNDMQKHADEEFNKGENYDQRSAQRVISEMEKRHELLMNPKGHPLSSFLTSAGFMYYLGLSPAAAIVNLSQTALIAYPLMGAKWNYDKAGKELLKASSDFAKGVEFKVPDFSSLESFKNSIGDVYSPNIDKVIKGLELDAYNKAVKRGVIDVTQAHDLAGIAQGEDSKVMWYFRPAMRLASGMFHHAERFNREVTFIAAYRLASQAGASHTEAFDQAMDMVYKGHFDYSSGNRARFMQGNIAKVVLLFKQYAQNMLYTLLRNAHQSIYALDPKDQKEARRALAGILGMHALAAGAIGLPITGMLATASLLIAKKSKLGAAAFGVAALAALASGGDDDDPYELENVIRNWLADIHPTFADLVFGGVPRAFSPVDLSGRVGLNNLIIPDVQDGIEGADWANAYASALLGPVAGIGTNIAKGMQLMGEGHYRRGLESMLPVVIRNPIKASRYADEGVLAKDGKVIQEDVGGVGLFSQAIGFSPSDVRTSMEGRSAIFAYRNKLSNGRKDLMDVWVNARQEDNSQGMEEAWTEILTYNQKVGQKNPSMRISRIQLMQRYKERERKNRDAGAGGVYLTKRERGAEEQGRFAFDE